MYKIYPFVKEIYYKDGRFFKKEKLTYFFNSECVNACRELKTFINLKKTNIKDADIVFSYNEKFKEESYKIDININNILINASSEKGFFYAVKTLKQIFEGSKEYIDTLDIYDEPILGTRGFMLDISRDKIPKVKQIKRIIDLMSDLKMNHFELYVEGFSFEYQSFKKYLENETPITVKEYLDLQKYCNDRCIDFVPNQNGFGHMTSWLEQDEFKKLAEIEEGIFLWGMNRKPSTLNPLDNNSIQLLEKMYQDMLPLTNSKYFNMNFDEPFELGKGKSKDECLRIGLENVYIDYVLKAYELIKKYQKTPLIWGDVLIKHPDSIKRLPEDMIFLEWGYDANHPFNENLQKIREQNKKFMTAPGTSSWCSFSGRTSCAIENINNAINSTINYQGEGSILTDWGDYGHLQYLPITYGPMIYFAFQTWSNKEGQYLELKNYLNKNIFMDKSEIMADFILDLGNYNRYEDEYRGNGTTLFYSFMYATYATTCDDPITYYKYIANGHKLSLEKYLLLKNYFKNKLIELKLCNLTCDDGKLIIKEMKQTIKYLQIMLDLNACYSDFYSKEEKNKLLNNLLKEKDCVLLEHEKLWLARNKSGGLNRSKDKLEKLFKFMEITLKDIER